jgi:16S rRNA (cytidine1402-2'-O)-methyltransferase
MSPMRLVLVPTPIGNLEDLTLRAIRVLREVEVVACEDTRRTGLLLRHLGLTTPTLRLDQHTMSRARERLAPYRYVAYASDAGTPGISDPGAELVRLAVQEGWEVEVLPGPTALIPALVLSGFPTAPFRFEGFLPIKGRARQERLESLPGLQTVVLYEAPHRLQKTLQELMEIYGAEHPVAVVRELSKLHEEVFRGSLKEAHGHFTHPKGEFVLILAPRVQRPDPQELLRALQDEGLVGQELVRALVQAGLPREEAYRRVHEGAQ